MLIYLIQNAGDHRFRKLGHSKFSRLFKPFLLHQNVDYCKRPKSRVKRNRRQQKTLLRNGKLTINMDPLDRL